MGDVDEATLEAARERPEDVAAVLTELCSLLVDSEQLDDTLQRVVDLATRTMPGCDAAGLTLVGPDGQFVTAVYTDERTLACDRGQYERDEGPCLDAIRNRRANRVDVSDAEARWPEFNAEAGKVGISSFLASPLVVDDHAIGALNLYSHARHGFDTLDETFIALLTAQAGVAVSNARRYAEVTSLAEQMRQALESRAVIEQAKGVLMSRQGIDAEAAFALLRTQSQHDNVKLRLVAQRVVDASQPQPREGRAAG